MQHRSAPCLITASLLLVAASLGGCDRSPTADNSAMQIPLATIAQPTAEQWQRVAQLHILFAHQSVGGNLLDGIQSLASSQHIPLVIAETRTPLAGPGIQHFKVGHNEDPNGKLVDFRTTFANTFANKNATPDIALLKFCFIDFTPSVDPQQLAQNYIATLDDLARTHPHTVFVPMTSPLTTVQSGPRAWLKKLLGQVPGGYASNTRRHTFNQALRAHYSGSQLFDLAALESGHGQNSVEVQGEHIEVLNPSLTDDGGHLNANAQRLFGGALIVHLATVAPSPAASSPVDQH